MAQIFSDTMAIDLLFGQFASVITTSLYQCLITPLTYSTTIYSWLFIVWASQTRAMGSPESTGLVNTWLVIVEFNLPVPTLKPDKDGKLSA